MARGLFDPVIFDRKIFDTYILAEKPVEIELLAERGEVELEC